MLRGLPSHGEILTMIVQSLRHAGWLALVASASASACSKAAATEDAYVAATLGAGAGATCPFSSANVVTAGTMTAGNLPESVTEGTGGLSLTCSVVPNGDGYDIQLDASLPGSSGGEFTANGHVTVGSADGLSGGGTVNAQFVSQTAGVAYEGTDCPVTYTYLQQPIAPAQRLSAGSIFAHISCPNAMSSGTSVSGMQVMEPDGSLGSASCDGEADILFQNCSQ
jgi:hypothetical protein